MNQSCTGISGALDPPRSVFNDSRKMRRCAREIAANQHLHAVDCWAHKRPRTVATAGGMTPGGRVLMHPQTTRARQAVRA